MKRLVYLHQHFRLPSANGGIRSYEFAKRLALAGYEVHIIGADSNNSSGEWTVKQVDGFCTHLIGVPYNNNMGFLARLWSFLKFMVAAAARAKRLQPDIVYATSTPLTIALPALLLKIQKNIPFVFEVRDLWPEIPVELGYIKNRLLKKFVYWFAKTAYERASHVVALSDDMKRGVCAYGIHEKKVTVIPNASDVDLLRHPTTDQINIARTRYPHIFLSLKKVLIYTGTVGRVNKVGYLVQLAAALRLSKLPICVAVFGDGGELDSVRNAASDLGVLNDNFFIEAPVSKIELAALLRLSHISISTVDNIPVLWGNSANKFFDAFAAGIPISVNHGGWQSDLIERHKCGVVLPPTDINQAVKRLEQFLFDDAQYRQACEVSAWLGDNVFSRELLFQDLLRVLKLAT